MTQEREILDSTPAAAAFLAAGIGCMALGLFTTLAQASTAIKDLLNWWDPAGPLTGKAGLAVIIWLAAWLVLHLAWKSRAVNFGRVFGVSLTLIAMGILGTFPTFFEAFGH